MSTLNVTADAVATNETTKVTGSLSVAAEVRLPVVGSGGSDVAAGTVIPVVNSGTGSLIFKTLYGHMIGVVRGKASAYVVARADGFYILMEEPTAFEPAEAIENGEDEDVNAILAALRNAGIIKSE